MKKFRFDCTCGGSYATTIDNNLDDAIFRAKKNGWRFERRGAGVLQGLCNRCVKEREASLVSSRPVAYVAGPYRSDTLYGIEQNIQRARSLAVELWKRGYTVICPHANSAFMDGTCSDDVFLKGGLELLRRSDLIVLLEGWEKSEGTRKELDFAIELGLPTYVENIRLPEDLNEEEEE